MNCAECTTKECCRGKDCTPCSEEIKETVSSHDLKTMRTAAVIESRYYKKKTRMEEIVLYAKEMGYRKVGLAFCVGLSEEAEKIHKILSQEFDVISVCCKVCGISKDDYELEKIEGESYEVMCNPIGQAHILNEEKTEFNIVVGLCVGHDTLVYKYSHAPVTTLAAKDRVLAHNPLGAIYSAYYRRV
jgi:uncharacterized metal-binding protein